MRGTSAKRYLLRQDVAANVFAEIALGVPVQRVMKNHSLDCSRPTVIKLVDAATLAETNETAKLSINPAWLDPDGPTLQAQPDGWIYKGRFPLGEWVCCSNT